MEEFLRSKVPQEPYPRSVPNVEIYKEDIEERYEAFSECDCSYIYKVATLSIIDGNKCDFAKVYLGYQRDRDSGLVYVGCLDFPNGENTDLGRTLKRLLECLERTAPIFEAD